MSVGQVRIRRSRIPARHPTGLYVHSSPPTVLPVPPSVVRQWLRGGEITRLTDLVLKGLGQTLVGEYSPDSKARKFIHILPKVLKRIEELHDAGRNGDIKRIETILSKEPKLNLELSRDCSGLGLLHKAVIHNHVQLQDWLIENYPATVNVLDKVKRNPLHYAGGSVSAEVTWKRLVAGGADINCVDNEGYTPAFYMHHPRRLRPPAPDSRGAARRQNSFQNMIVKPSTIRIWIHDKDLGRLQKVLWEGLGDRLRTETSANPLVRRFLNAVPYIMGSIKEIHSAAVNNDLELLVLRSADPVPKDILLSKDVNGLTPLHKAAGLGHMEIAKEILRKAPEAANMKDILDRTPLHYAAALRDQGEMFQFLVDSGSIDHIEDKKGNTPSYYHGKPAELDGPKLLTVIPEAPRTAHIFPPSWDWKLLGGKDPVNQDSISTASPQETEDPPTVPDNQDLVDREDEPGEEQTVSAPASQEEEEQEQEEEISPRPDMSEDEGVGSEVPVSGEDVLSPQSDTINEEYEIPQEAELADSVNVSDQPLANNANVELGNDSGNEEEEKELAEGFILDDVDDVNKDLERDESKEPVEENSKTPDDDNNIEQSQSSPQENMDDPQQSVCEISLNNDHLQNSLDEVSLAHTIQNSYGIDRLNSAEELTNESANSEEESNKDETGSTEDRINSVEVEQINEIKTEEIVDYEREITQSSGSDNVFFEKVLEDNEVNNESEEVNEDVEREIEEENLDSNQEKEDVEEDSKQEEEEEEEATTPTPGNDVDNVSPVVEGDDDNNKLEQTQLEPSSPNSRLSTSSGELVPLRIYSRSAEVLAITPADPEEMDDPQLQEAVAGRTPESSRQKAYELVKSGDMEAMAELVLSGQGASLLGLVSDNPDVQLFINNVPHYIAKIERVHKAAREGDLRAVQTALDRRKFAVARDNSTPLKPTPLHVAALFGRTSILRYLAGRFPETMHAQDSAGRTPLHYAATLPDNGHFYSLLVTLGADKAFPDNAGRIPEEYLKNKGELTRESLLADYQNRDIPIDMSGLNFTRYSDKGAELVREGYPIFNPEEGQYLADSLGEPLIKGLTEVAQLRPKNPVVHLANYLLSYDGQEDVGKRRSISCAEELRVKTEGTGELQDSQDVPPQTPPLDVNENEESLQEGDEEQENINEEDDTGSDITVDEPVFKTVNRDEHGQSMLHFAAARAHGRNAMFQLLQEMDGNVGLRDALYRTPRDVANQLDIQDNVKSIDKYVVSLAARGEDEKLKDLMVEGYDHILDAEDDDKNIFDIVSERDNESTLKVLQGISAFEERREKLHRAIRFGSWQESVEALRGSECPRRLATAKNQQGRCALHVAVLTQNENIVEHIAKKYPATLRVGDNLMRTPLHYAMGVEKVEPLSRILIAAGAQRVLKDLKGRQPSYYFMNKTDIKKLQDEEEALRV
ncbi:uncharacterized protein isoform X3 [Rhodnius prolixus]|uniref:uncharacterized protein isoform X3 n=1 Tax=Rhodnius prolixus TaxID=13249 RepID=UPI003D18789A